MTKAEVLKIYNNGNMKEIDKDKFDMMSFKIMTTISEDRLSFIRGLTNKYGVYVCLIMILSTMVDDDELINIQRVSHRNMKMMKKRSNAHDQSRKGDKRVHCTN